MISAVDTNILLDILRPNPDYVDSSTRLLEDSARLGTLMICEIVYAELAAQFPDQASLDRFLEECLIGMESLGRAEAYQAGRLWRDYRAAGGARGRVISDFLIGAHALFRAGRLLSRDRGFYSSHFSGLTVVSAPD